MNWRSITFRLVFLYCGLLLLLGASFYVFTIASFERYTHETIRTDIAVRAKEIWDSAQGVIGEPRKLKSLINQRFAPELQDRFIRISVNGKPIYQSQKPAQRSFDPRAVPIPKVTAVPRQFIFGKLYLYVRSFVAADGRVITIESGQSDEFATGVEKSLGASILIGLPVLLILAAAGSYVLIRRALTPVELMITAAEAITFNDPHNRLPLLGTGDRIEALGHALNRMLDRLDSAYQHVGRFSTDAAHELRTPLAIIRGELEFIGRNRKLSDDIQTAFGTVLEEVARLSGIVDSLNTLSRMDSLWGKRNHSAVDISTLASETVEQMQLIAEAKQVSIRGPTTGGVFVAGDKDRLKQVLVNLIDNGIKYNVQGGALSVEVSEAADQALIVVSDTGIGITPEDQQFIFDRFYRVSTDRGESGAGLGLAIVKSICHAHGGSVAVTSGIDGGSLFFVELPLWTARASI